MAWEFLRPVLTANALATVQANPVLLAYFVAWLLVIMSIMSLALYISYVTGKPYRKPKKAPPAGKAGAAPTPAEKARPPPSTANTSGSRFSMNMKLPSFKLPDVKLPNFKVMAVKSFFKK
jgi:hypothetical protein